jgi:hypothetical protein
MADVAQQEKTKVIYYQNNLITERDDYPVDVKDIKILGLYTRQDFKELKKIFHELLKLIESSGPALELYPLQDIKGIRIRESRVNSDAGHETELTSSKLRPDDPEFTGNPHEYIFFVDVISLIFGIATTLQREFYGKELTDDVIKDFADPDTEEYYLKKWGLAQGRTYLSQEALAREKGKLEKIFASIYQAFNEIEPNLVNADVETKEQTEEEEIAELEAEKKELPTNVEDIIEAVEQRARAQNEGSSSELSTSASSSVTNLEDPETQLALAKQKQWVLEAARVTLLDRVLLEAGLNPDLLPADLQLIRNELRSILEAELSEVFADAVAELSPEDLANFVSGTGQTMLRLKIYRKLLFRLFSQSENGFFVLYKDLYTKQIDAYLNKDVAAQTAEEHEKEAAQAEKTALAAVALVDTAAGNEALEVIHEQLQDWKAELQEKLQKLVEKRAAVVVPAPAPSDDSESVTEQEQTTEQPADALIFSADEDDQTATQTSESESSDTATDRSLPSYDLPAAPITLTSIQLSPLTAAANARSLTPTEQTALPRQAGHVVWGTLAQLFPEETLRNGTIPPQLFEKVNTAAIEYLSGLSGEELHKLSRSPSSLIRHIKNLSMRMQTDAVFAAQYQTFAQTVAPPVIDRAERLEIETNWAIENVKYELFTTHNITTELITKSPELEKEFLDAENKLESKVYAFILGLSNEELLQLYLDPKKRTELFEQITKSLNADPAFKKELGEFYSELIHYYQENGLTVESEALPEQLAKTTHYRTVQQDGGTQFIIDDVKNVDSKNLFIDELKRGLNDDSAPVLQNATNILDAMLLTDGPEVTANLIQKLDTRLLGMMFSLPENEINASNHQTIREILINYTKVRVNNLSPAEGAVTNGIFATPRPIPTTTEQVVTHRQPLQGMTKLVEENGAETATNAVAPQSLRKKKDLFAKIVAKQWDNLSLEEAAAVYLWIREKDPKTSSILPEDLRIRIAGHNADPVADKMALRPPIEFLSFRGNPHDLVAAAERGNWKILVFEGIPPRFTDPNDTVSRAYHATVEQHRLQHQIAYANWQQQEESLRQQIAQELNTTIDEINKEYEAAILGQAQAALETEAAISDLDRVAIGAGVISGAAVAGGALTTATVPELPFASPTAAQLYANPGTQAAAQTAAQSGGLAQFATSALRRRLFSSAANAAGGAAASAAGAALGVAGGPIGWITTARTIWNNPELRRWVAGLGTWGVSQLLTILTNGAGLLTLGAGLFLGPGAFLPTLLLARIAAGQLPWLQIPGLNIRTPNFFNSFGADAAEGSLSGTRSMAQMRAEANAGNTAATQNAANQAAQNASANPPTSPNSPPPQTQGGSTTSSSPNARAADGGVTSGNALTSNPAATTATATSSSSIFSLSNIGLVAPAIGLAAPFILTIFTIIVISGAFMAPVPTKPGSIQPFTPSGEQATSKYVTITKTADKGGSPNQIKNRTATDVTYTITITPKAGYTIKINSATDTFTSFGKQTTTVTSPFDVTKLPADPFQSAADPITYTINTGTGFEDAFITNKFTITFDVLDPSGFVSEKDVAHYATASIYVGNPPVGCFEFGPAGRKIGNLTSKAWTPKEQQQLLTAYTGRIGANATYQKLLCEDGPINIYRLPGSPYGGWAFEAGKSIALYDLAFSSQLATDYTLLHELGHIMDGRNTGLRQQYIAQFEAGAFSCLTYPHPSMCSHSESFAEGVAIYVINWKNYSLNVRYPTVYEWLKTTIFGGTTYIE